MCSTSNGHTTYWKSRPAPQSSRGLSLRFRRASASAPGGKSEPMRVPFRTGTSRIQARWSALPPILTRSPSGIASSAGTILSKACCGSRIRSTAACTTFLGPPRRNPPSIMSSRPTAGLPGLRPRDDCNRPILGHPGALRFRVSARDRSGRGTLAGATPPMPGSSAGCRISAGSDSIRPTGVSPARGIYASRQAVTIGMCLPPAASFRVAGKRASRSPSTCARTPMRAGRHRERGVRIHRVGQAGTGTWPRARRQPLTAGRTRRRRSPKSLPERLSDPMALVAVLRSVAHGGRNRTRRHVGMRRAGRARPPRRFLPRQSEDTRSCCRFPADIALGPDGAILLPFQWRSSGVRPTTPTRMRGRWTFRPNGTTEP